MMTKSEFYKIMEQTAQKVNDDIKERTTRRCEQIVENDPDQPENDIIAVLLQENRLFTVQLLTEVLEKIIPMSD